MGTIIMGEMHQYRGRRYAQITGSEDVDEVAGTVHFFAHCGLPYDGMAITHRLTGALVGVYSAEYAQQIMDALEAAGADWKFTDPASPKAVKACRLTQHIVNAYPELSGRCITHGKPPAQQPHDRSP